MSEKAELAGIIDCPPRRPRRSGKITTAFLLACTALCSLALTTPFDISPLAKFWQQRPQATSNAFWTKCARIGYHERTLCAGLTAPLDYFDRDAGTARIPLAMYPATKVPSKGIILINPGGPGGSGAAFAGRAGSQIQAIVGEEWDIVGFDPRGTGLDSQPLTKCFTGQTNYAEFIRNTVLHRSYDIASNLSLAEAREKLIALHTEAEDLYEVQFKVCEKTMGETLKYMGTSTVVRDIDYITRYLAGEDALINFWGFSYYG